MVKIIKQELPFEESLKQRLEFICEFSKVTRKFVNDSIRNIENEETKLLKLQKQYRSGKIKEKNLTEEQVNSL